MLRICTLFLLLTFHGGMLFANIDVELDVVFKDTTVQCRYLYVLSQDRYEIRDTLAVFDTLSFKRNDRVSLFYTVENDKTNILLMVDSAGMVIESKPFRIFSGRVLRTRNAPAVFTVVIEHEKISVANKNYLYLKKNENLTSYLAFLFIFLTVKLLITTYFVLLSALPKRIIAFASCFFILTAFIDWFIPLYYIYRFFITILAEFLLISVIGRKFISWLQAAMLILIVNIAGFGIIAFMYILYVFW